MYLIGVLQALGIVLVDTLYNLFIKFTGVNFELKAFIFPFYYLLGNALALMIFAGPGRFALDTVKDLSTWIYGVAYLASFIVEIYLIQYVSSTELSILLRLTVPVCIILAFLKHRRAPNKYDYISLITIGLSVGLIFDLQAPEVLMNVVLLCAVLALFEAMGYFIPENHSVNKQAIESSGMRGRARVISFATFVTTSLMLIALILFAYIDSIIPISKYFGLESNFIKLEDFIHLPTVLSGLLFGTLLAPFIRYFQWSASYKITSEGVLTIMAIIPLVTFTLEYILISVGFMPTSALFESGQAYYLFGISLVLALGTWISAYLKTKDQILKANGRTIIEKIKNAIKIKEQVMGIGYSTSAMADYEIIKNTIDFYEGDKEKAAEILEIPLDTIITLSLSSNNYSLRPDVSKKVHDIFRNKVFYLDQLTGIENKKGLVRAFTEFKDKNTKFNLYYMDINKFKQINDTLGHNVGDVALIETAKRLDIFAKDNNAKVFRLGGDEFAMLTTSHKTEEKIISQLKHALSQPINYSVDGKAGVIEPSMSIGKAKTLKDDDIKIKDLIQSADEEMYEDKKAFHATV
jgi:diguanylate cyclase (GGDEF)-like protein